MKNKLAGKHPSYGNMSEERIAKKIAYDKAYHQTEERKKYRAELNKKNREAGTYGKMTSMGKDMSHTKEGKLVPEAKGTNRARNGQNKKSTKK